MDSPGRVTLVVHTSLLYEFTWQSNIGSAHYYMDSPGRVTRLMHTSLLYGFTWQSNMANGQWKDLNKNYRPLTILQFNVAYNEIFLTHKRKEKAGN